MVIEVLCEWVRPNWAHHTQCICMLHTCPGPAHLVLCWTFTDT